MASAGKWAMGLAGDTPFTAAGNQILMQRLAIVSHYFPLAARYADEDVEYVHQLRVSTRRGTAALHLFAEILPPARGRAVSRRMRDIRRGAGTARELDVFLLRLGAYRQRLSAAELETVRGLLAGLRREAQQPLRKIYRRLGKGRLQRRCTQLLDRTRWRGCGAEPRWSCAALSHLRPLVEQAIVPPSGLNSIEDLHQFRIACKRLRYALELTVDAVRADVNQALYGELKELQARLGTINDHAFIRDRARGWMTQAHRGQQRVLQAIVDFEDAELARAERTFRSWWTDERADEFRHDWSRLGCPSTETPAR